MLITGKGRCNITNDTDIRGMVDNIPVNGKFLYSAFNAFSNWDMVSLLEELGVHTKVERGGRIFPKSDRAVDVVDALSTLVTKSGVKILRDEVVDAGNRREAIYPM